MMTLNFFFAYHNIVWRPQMMVYLENQTTSKENVWDDEMYFIFSLQLLIERFPLQ
jgi:hypothetical protein